MVTMVDIARVAATGCVLFSIVTAARAEDGPDEKPRNRVGQIIIIGNNLTPEWFIRRQIPFSPGETVTSKEFRAAEKNVARLDFFYMDATKGIRPTVGFLDEDSDTTTKDVLVAVEERRENFLPFVFEYPLQTFDLLGNVYLGIKIVPYKIQDKLEFPFGNEVRTLFRAATGHCQVPIVPVQRLPQTYRQETEMYLALLLVTFRSWPGEQRK
jgi:hypothetical protein